MKDTNELKEMTSEELQSELIALRKDQFNLRMKKANGTLDKTHLVTLVRKAVARVKTILNEKAGNRHV